MGLLDVVAENGCGEIEMQKFINKIEKTHNTRKAIHKIRRRISPVSYKELLDVGEIWVESSMSLSSKELRTMQRLIRSQDKMARSLVKNAGVFSGKEGVGS
jgi:DSF synthase